MFHKPLDVMFPHPPAGLDPSTLKEESVPQHVAVIMDGNGRWAKKRALNRLKGHQAGIGAVRETIRAASDCGVRFLTIYSFATENGKRPAEEVSGLMELFAKTMLAEVDGLHEENVRVRTIGDISMLPQETRDAFGAAWEKTRHNTGMTLLVAVNYGGRQEILQAVNSHIQRVLDRGEASCPAEPLSVEMSCPAEPYLTEEGLSKLMYTFDAPDPELVIRTSGEFRVSNFLLWQIAYSEFYVTDVLWPDFDRYEFLRALLSYQGRERRFGAV